MKSLISYLLEDKQTYDFKIKTANIDLNDETLDRMEHALQAFEVVSMSKPKSLPIKDKNIDFPSLSNCEVSLILVSLKYPCTDEQVRQTLSQHGRISLASIVVTPKNQPEELMRDEDDTSDEKSNNKYEPLLTKELENTSGGQIQVGQKRLDSMLKELESTKFEYAAKNTEKLKTTNELPQGNTSPYKTKVSSVRER